MESLPWFWIWVILAAVLCVGEMLAASFFMLPFAIGAGTAAIASALNAPLWLQFVVMIAVSVIALILIRPLARRITRNNVEKTGVDRLVGRVGVVIERGGSLGGGNLGGDRSRSETGSFTPGSEFCVSVERDEWNAVCDNGATLPPGAEIEVLRVEGAHLVVQPAAARFLNIPSAD
jgi:membrane protein implicated in regulation of membrane protease activity